MPVDTASSSGVLGIVLLVYHVIVEEPRRLGTGMGNQRFFLGHFQFEGISQELSSLLLDCFRFRSGTSKTEQGIVRIPYIVEPPIVVIIGVARRKLLELLSRLFCFLQFPLLILSLGSPFQCIVYGVTCSFFSSCVGWNEGLFNILIELVEVDIPEDRRDHAPLRASAQSFIDLPFLEVPTFKQVPDESKQPLIVDLFAKNSKQDIVVHRVEELGDVAFNKPASASPVIVDFTQGGMASSSWSKPMRMTTHVRLVICF